MNKTLQILRRKKSKTKSNGLRMVLSGLEQLMQKEDELPPVINFNPTVEVNLPEPAPINITVEPADTPEIIVPQAPINIQPTPIEISVESPTVEVNPEIKLPASTRDKSSKYEVVEILERDASGEIKKVRKERIDE